eukprot:CAMPEP_0119305160 /NCGR_PEP_ID=MMETSP1333-20130426/6224_1 /TAXON_ID=418940 /ORGANISM="Scyphosphaera apsteinii, Strain RCC1455" /LENGTH=328 /DNA_ID=CAMNT_0007308183 /DNA_START=54 /DNA_END=1040 /DNA_ORIENTATION=+
MGAKPNAALHNKLTTPGGLFECRPNGKPLAEGRCYTAADAQVDFMTSGSVPAGSKLLVLAPNDDWAQMICECDQPLFESWEILTDMDVDTAKEWSQHAKAWLEWETATLKGQTPTGMRPPKVAVVFFTDGLLASDWSFDLIHAVTILLNFGAEFIYTSEDETNPSIDWRFPNTNFPTPGPGMFVEMFKQSIPAHYINRCICSGKGGKMGRKFMMDRAIQMLKQQGHSGERDQIMIIGDRFNSDIRAGVLSGIKSCLLESGAHTLELKDEFPTDIPSYTAPSIAHIAPAHRVPRRKKHVPSHLFVLGKVASRTERSVGTQVQIDPEFGI